MKNDDLKLILAQQLVMWKEIQKIKHEIGIGSTSYASDEIHLKNLQEEAQNLMARFQGL